MSRAVSLALHSYELGKRQFGGTPTEAFGVAAFVVATEDGLTDAERGEALRALAHRRCADETKVVAL